MLPSLALQAAAAALCGIGIVVRAARIRLLVPDAAGSRPSLTFAHAIALNAYGDAAAAITPGRLGGDPARFAGFRRARIDTPRAIAALAVEALIDWVLLVAASVGLALAFGDTVALGARRLASLAAGPQVRALVALTLALALASAVAWRRLRHRVPQGLATSLAESWRQSRAVGPRTVAVAGSLTTLSMLVRTAILPVLAAGLPGLDPRAVLVGSFALLYGQLIVPTPAGAGAVELGFLGGFGGGAGLLLAWRAYTLLLPAGLGAVLAARAALATRARGATPASPPTSS